ncbi:MAG TPA: hypothetical protein VN278_03435 [Methanosarcina sp.]|nr:hypothetical protein [Methanosarcina sp.]
MGRLDFALNLNYEVLQRSSVGKSLNGVGETRIINALGRYSIGCNTVDACHFNGGSRHK